MDRASALNLYRRDLLGLCEIFKCKGNCFKIKIHLKCLNEISFHSESETLLTEIFEDSPMEIDDLKYAIKVAKRIGFKENEIKIKEKAN